jgi:hypothetical protein
MLYILVVRITGVIEILVYSAKVELLGAASSAYPRSKPPPDSCVSFSIFGLDFKKFMSVSIFFLSLNDTP